MTSDHCFILIFFSHDDEFFSTLSNLYSQGGFMSLSHAGWVAVVLMTRGGKNLIC